MAIFTALTAAVGSLVSSVTASAFFSTTIGKFIVQTIARAATSFLVNAILGGNKNAFSIQGKLQAGENTPRGAPVGKSMVAGSLVYANEWGRAGKTPNAYFTQVIALSDIPVKGLSRVMVNGVWVTLLTPADADKGFPVQEYRKGSTDYLWIKFYDGTQTVADTFLTGTVSTADRPYESTRVGVGVAYAITTARAKAELFSGFPAFKFELDSIRLYDPSKDSTVGGSGTQRWATPSTWGGDGDDLPVVQAYNIMRGISYGGVWQYGFQGMSAGRLPVAAWIDQIAQCRATVATSASTSEPAYRSSGYLPFDTECGSALEAIMAACAGRIADIGGIYKPMVGYVPAAVAAIDDGDLLSTQDAPFYPIKGLADTVNAVTAQYPDPAEGYALKDAPAIYRSDLEAIDANRRLPAQVTLSNVPYALQVQRLMSLVIEEARRTRSHTIPLPADYWALEPNDIIEWTSTRHGYTSKKFRVNAVIDQPTAEVICDIVEIDPADYDFSYSDYVATTTTAQVLAIPDAHDLPSWNVTATTIQDGSAIDRRPALLLEWDSDGMDDLTAIAYEIRLTGGAVVKRGTITDIAAEAAIIAEGILPSTAYEARALGNSLQATDWTAWDAATTAAVQIGQIDLDGSKLQSIVLGPVSVTSNTIQTHATLDLGAIPFGQIWKRAVVVEARRTFAVDYTIRLERRIMYAGVWGAWETQATFTVTSNSWDIFASSGTFAGSYDDFEYRVVSVTSGTTATGEIRNLYVTAVNIVK